MTPEQFAYWLQGFAELHAAPPDADQWKQIRDHLATVFHKVTPKAPAYAPPAAAPFYPSPLDQWLRDNPMGNPPRVVC